MPRLTSSPAGTVDIGDLRVQRLGFGSMRLALTRSADGERSREAAHALIRRAVERGVTFIDTANIYGLGRSEELIAEALRPYPLDVVVGTKSGYETRSLAPGEQRLPASGHPDHLISECERSLARLGVERIDLYQLHTPDPVVPLADSLGALVELQQQGKIRHIGISNVSPEQLDEARSICRIVSVQNRYNAGDRSSEELLRMCERLGIVFIPWHPIVRDEQRMRIAESIATAHGATAQQVTIAWLLQRSPVVLPIPGTTSAGHLDVNIDAAWIRLTDDEFARLGATVDG
ncbi:aldo/keto reductase [uncultured Jatrophihabitans sp.]|uniref:aldo/keto reductase n=1 Tax=uncultured Jatrophihabitans sp. TaxID=1610747 RepID=UPI0035CB492B